MEMTICPRGKGDSQVVLGRGYRIYGCQKGRNFPYSEKMDP